MSKLGNALGFPSPDKGVDMGGLGSDDEGDASDELEPPQSAKEKSGGSAEVLAMKQFERASTPEAKVQALKDFGEACGWTGSSGY